ncbi:Hypothetical protein MVR_LOCUS34 [uncultured virus]|nr:Hypothetical protein MVR_LOCUS34 [uncultured virus]
MPHPSQPIRIQLTHLADKERQVTPMSLSDKTTITTFNSLDITPVNPSTVVSCRFWSKLEPAELIAIYKSFDKLESLYLSHQDLEAVDLVGINPNLKLLDISNNRITHVDTVHIPNVTHLIAGYNPLRTLDITPCRKLTSVLVPRCDLYNLNVDQCSDLHHLDVFGNIEMYSVGISALEHIGYVRAKSAYHEVKVIDARPRTIPVHIN